MGSTSSAVTQTFKMKFVATLAIMALMASASYAAGEQQDVTSSFSISNSTESCETSHDCKTGPGFTCCESKEGPKTCCGDLDAVCCGNASDVRQCCAAWSFCCPKTCCGIGQTCCGTHCCHHGYTCNGDSQCIPALKRAN